MVTRVKKYLKKITKILDNYPNGWYTIINKEKGEMKMKRKVTEKDIINPGLELDLTTGYATPETILCLSDSERIRALKELEKYDDRDIIAVVFCGTLIPNGVELYGVFPQNELAEVWSSWGKPVGWYRDILQEGYIDISDWWKRKGEQYGHQKN